MSLHKEISFELEVCQHLAAHGWLYTEGDASAYDRARALFSPDVLAWVQATQSKAWATLTKNHGGQAEQTLLSRLRDQLDQRGTLDSGKTNSIAWTAHFLAELHDEQHNKLFDTVLVVSDRDVIDTQLQEALFDFARTVGVVATIKGKQGSKSSELAEALSGAKKIVVCTIQTFPFALQEVRKLAATKGKRFAVIADEAHSSQTGEAAKKLKALLSAEELQELNDGGELSTEDILAAEMATRADDAGITFVAFTATPKTKTMELFGTRPDPSRKPAPDNKPAPFHVYSIGPDLRLAIVGAPSYFALRPEPKSPQDLVNHSCINFRQPSAGGLYAWEFEKRGRELNVRVDGQLIFNRTPPMLNAARAGFGLACLMDDTVQADLEEGRLKRVLADWCPPFSGYHLYYPNRRQLSPAFVLLVNALRYKREPSKRAPRPTTGRSR